MPTLGALQECYDALRNQHCRSFDDPGPGGLRHRLSTKNVRHVFADESFQFGGRTGGASRTRAASSGQSGEPNRANRRRTGSGTRRRTDANGGGGTSRASGTACRAESGASTRGAGVNSNSGRRTERRGAAETRAGRHFHTAVRQARRNGPGAHRRNRHDGGPGFGFEHFKQYDFLRDKEVVLTFDDGPWPGNTPAVLKALADECLKATFFEIGEHATWHPEITKQVIAAGMTLGTHTWSHKDLARNPYAKDIELAKTEIEMGFSAVNRAAGPGKVAPFFRFPALQHPPQLLSYLAERNMGVFSTDINSRRFQAAQAGRRDQIGDEPA